MRTESRCLPDVEEDLHYEQRWLDSIPSLAPSFGIVRDPGIHVGHWNPAERRIEVREERVMACGRPCRIFRFSGYDPDHPERVTRYSRRAKVAELGGAAEGFAAYHNLLLDGGRKETRNPPYGWDQFDNDTPIRPGVRRLHRRQGRAAERFGNPFSSLSAENFYGRLQRRHPGWLRRHSDGSTAGIGHCGGAEIPRLLHR
ncbi:MAG: hypothetical protein ACUVS7_18925, partial [Bryobacteraceae bacterium]